MTIAFFQYKGFISVGISENIRPISKSCNSLSINDYHNRRPFYIVGISPASE